MNVLMIDGFDLYNGTGVNTGLQGKWVAGSVGGASLVAGRFGGQGFRIVAAAGGTYTKPLTAASGSICFGLAFKMGSIPAGSPTTLGFFGLKTGATFQCGINIGAAGVIQAYRLSSVVAGTLLGASASGLLVANTYNYLEVEIVLSTSVGRITIYLNGGQVLNLTGINTANAGAGTTADTFFLNLDNGGNAPSSIEIDDVYVIDTAAKLGERRVETLRPSADTAQKDWTPSTGATNFGVVDDTTADATDYVAASTVGNLDLYDLSDLSSTPAAIDAVQFSAFALKTDATARNIALVGDIAGSQSQTADMVLPASAIKFESIRAAKPGGGAWDAASVNSLRLGPKVTV
jgi:hypothetical protein